MLGIQSGALSLGLEPSIPAAFYDKATQEVQLHVCKTQFNGKTHIPFIRENYMKILRKINQFCEFTEVEIPFDINSSESIELYLKVNTYDEAENSGSSDEDSDSDTSDSSSDDSNLSHDSWSSEDNEENEDKDKDKKDKKSSVKQSKPFINRRFKHRTVRNYNTMFERSNATRQCYKYLVMFNRYNIVETINFKSYYDFLEPLLLTADYKMFNIIIPRVSIYEIEEWKEKIDFFVEEATDLLFTSYIFNNIRRNYNTISLNVIFSDFDADICKKLWVSGWNPQYKDCVNTLNYMYAASLDNPDGIKQIKRIIKVICKYYFFDTEAMKSEIFQKP
jgi:hypothetical protein